MLKYTLSPQTNQWLQDQVLSLGHNLNAPKSLASLIVSQSTDYQNKESTTDWSSKSKHASYLSYFFPLNMIRSLKVLDEAMRWDFFAKVDKVVDFGSGPGTLTQALLHHPKIQLKEIAAYDNTPELASYFRGLSTPETQVNYFAQTPPPPPTSDKTALLASYAFNELSQNGAPNWIYDYTHILLIEPSTQVVFSNLLKLRKELIDRGFTILAPCPHQGVCSMSHSRKDWCHDRVYWEQPPWFAELEKELPIKNPSLTFSYLIATRKPPATLPHYWRVVGDGLKEKGKTKWLICKDSDRNFISFLKRSGRAPLLYRGERITLNNFEEKGNELRFTEKDIQRL